MAMLKPVLALCHSGGRAIVHQSMSDNDRKSHSHINVRFLLYLLYIVLYCHICLAPVAALTEQKFIYQIYLSNIQTLQC